MLVFLCEICNRGLLKFGQVVYLQYTLTVRGPHIASNSVGTYMYMPIADL